MKSGADLLPGQVLGRRLGEAAIEFLTVPIRHRYLIWRSGNAVPRRLDQMKAIRRRKSEDLLEDLVSGHARNLG